MKTSLTRLTAIALLAGAFCVSASAGERLVSADAMILRHAERSGGGLSTAVGMELLAMIGDIAPRSFTSAGSNMESGYAPMSSQPGSVISITTMTKSTDTLMLTWKAPGRDGFLAPVTNGFYRVDYSSDSLHIFSPTTYLLEFSTSVAVDDVQSLQLTGLLPNTTYYTKIYLADERKFFAENSVKAAQSTLANVPVNPAITSVSDSSVTISWVLPAGAAEGFKLEASTTDFGALLPGGLVVTSMTADGLLVSLTLENLTPLTTYFFHVGSLNWQGENNYTVILGTVTLASSNPLPVTNLLAIHSPLTRQVLLTWSNPTFQNRKGVVVVASTSSATDQIVNGQAYAPGQVLLDSATVKSTSLVTSYNDSNLTLNSTYFYHLFTYNTSNEYSTRVTTAVFLDLPPLAAAGLTCSIDSAHTQFTLNWKPVTSNSDGSPFAAAPKTYEIERYEIYRSTMVLNANWVLIATMSTTVDTYTDILPDPAQTYLYKIDSVDSFGSRDLAMSVDTDRNLYAFTSDGVTRIQVPPELVSELLAENNRYKADILFRATPMAPDADNKAFTAARFDVLKTPNIAPAEFFQFSRPGATVALRYETLNGLIVPTGTLSLSSLAPQLAPANQQDLGMYWYNGSKWVKMFGSVDAAGQTLQVDTAMGGPYQIRALTRSSAFHFDVSQISNKVITPNGDSLNDLVLFTFENPFDSAFTGKILDGRGGYVSSMSPGPIRNTLQWDGKANGRQVLGGVYIYQISAENRNWSGTILVVK